MDGNKGKKHLIDNASLMAEWNYEKNIDIDPSKLTLGSHKKVWWICSEGHEWETTIKNKTRGNGCPYCSGRFAIKGKTDLLTLNSDLSIEWNYEKNGNLKPDNFTTHSGKKVWWICSEGHEWQAVIQNRTKGSNCPYCAGKKAIQGNNDLATTNPILAKEWNFEKNNGLTPTDVMPNSIKKVWWKCTKGHEWQATIGSRSRGTGCPVCSSEKNTSLPEYAILYYLKKCDIDAIHSYKKLGYELDIYIPLMKIAIEYDGYYWHKNKIDKDLEKNSKCKKDGIKLYRIREGLPSLNNSSIDYTIQKNQKDFPEILKKILNEITKTNVDVDLKRDNIEIENLREYTEKENSLLFSNPSLASEWNYEKNGNLKPEFFLAKSERKVWWKCQKGHEWQAAISSRNTGVGCPFCAGQKVIRNTNDLQTINPHLASEWNHEKNSELTPNDVLPNSGKKVWWKCTKGHEWQAIICDRNNGRGCPYCSNKKVLKGYNDLATLNPYLANEWNYEKNGILNPTNFTNHSGKKVWWKCSKGHEWQATIDNRNRGTGCPYCSGRKKA